MEAEHDGEGAGRQQLSFALVLRVLLVVVFVQAVGRRQGKSVANLEITVCEQAHGHK